jgi:hypothetical protein
MIIQGTVPEQKSFVVGAMRQLRKQLNLLYNYFQKLGLLKESTAHLAFQQFARLEEMLNFYKMFDKVERKERIMKIIV